MKESTVGVVLLVSLRTVTRLHQCRCKRHKPFYTLEFKVRVWLSSTPGC